MERRVFLLESQKYYRFGSLYIVNKEVINNIFNRSYISSQAIQWCIRNEKKVKRLLYHHFKELSVFNGDINSCYTYVLSYFEKENKVFNQNYSGDSKYKVEQYVLGNLRILVLSYVSSLSAKTSFESNTESETLIINDKEFSIIDKEQYVDVATDRLEKEELLKKEYVHLLDLWTKYLLYKNYNSYFIQQKEYLLKTIFLEPISENIDVIIYHISQETTFKEKDIHTLLRTLKEDYLISTFNTKEIYKALENFLKIKYDVDF